MRLSKQTAEAVYAILVEECGARTDNCGAGQDAFVSYTARDYDHHEFRFGGSLGFGGKVYVSQSQIRVAYYPEDRTPARDKAMLRANDRLERVVIE